MKSRHLFLVPNSGDSNCDLLPGNELDALVARHVFGWQLRPSAFETGSGYVWLEEGFAPASLGHYRASIYSTEDEAIKSCPRFSWDWTYSGEVIENLDERGWTLHLEKCTRGWTASFRNARYPNETDFERSGWHGPHVICLAALALPLCP